MNKLFSLLLAAAMFSCNSETTTVTTETDSSSPSVPADNTIADQPKDTTASNAKPDEVCYQYILKRDTMVMHLRMIGDEVSGNLVFDNYEKDGSSGRVNGKRMGDIIKLLYTFRSEGMTSVAEEYFKVSGSDLVRGTGEIANKGDTVYFTDPNKIQYNGGKFARTDCEAIDRRYKF